MIEEITPFVHEHLAQRVVFGWGRFADVPSETDKLGAGSVLVITERSTRPLADRLQARMPDRVKEIIGPVRAHVPRSDAQEAAQRATDLGVDLVITIGGGSATGMGKAIALTGTPLLAIPTTYSGSEATPIHGTSAGGRKVTGRDPLVLPKTVVYDPALTVTLPPRVTASTGMNAIAHCVEALYGEHVSPITTLLAREGLSLLRRSLPACVREPDSREARSSALLGAYLAGAVLAVTGMAIHHRICHVLGGAFGVPHGDANAVVLPHAAAFNEPAAPDALGWVAEELGASSAGAGLFALARSIDAPASLRELGLQEHDIDQVVELVLEGNHFNPRRVEEGSLRALLLDALEGRAPSKA